MKPLLELFVRGGPVMIAIVALSVVLYSRCFKLLLVLWQSHRQLRRSGSALAAAPIEALQDSFRHQRIALGAMIAAAPLLGLLGTVSGMMKTFYSLSARSGEQTMEGLARGISEVLVATESGLLVALPALLFVYIAHREVHRLAAQVNRLDPAAKGIAS